MNSERDRFRKVAIEPRAALVSRPRLFAALEAAFPIRFGTAARADSDAVIVFSEGGVEASDAAFSRDGTPTLVVAGCDGGEAEVAVLASSDAVDQRVRGISVLDTSAQPGLRPVDGTQVVLAASGSGPVWTCEQGPAPIHRVRSTLPELDRDAALRELFHGHAVAAIALVQFLRELTEPDAAKPKAIRAAILFDDPNLRWKTYGFVDYQELVEHADAHGYHAAMAMIPLDGKLQHRATVNLFRSRPDRLSLVLHGNNHVANELMQPMCDRDALAIAAQAMRRAHRFESRYDLQMDRVMTPPHGMCGENVTAALGSLGFDALCAIHPYPWTERPPSDRPLAGWDPAEFAGGCAVIPRIHFSESDAEIAIRAFLGHPLVLYGHHEDLSGGLGPLAEIVSKVNRLGAVRWSSIGEIAMTNYSGVVEAGTYRVRPYSHHLRLDVPQGVERLVIERPRNADQVLAGWSAGPGPSIAFGAEAACGPGNLDLRLDPVNAIDPGSVPSPPPPVWPILRRAATETRDRLRPLLQVGSSS